MRIQILTVKPLLITPFPVISPAPVWKFNVISSPPPPTPHERACPFPSWYIMKIYEQGKFTLLEVFIHQSHLLLSPRNLFFFSVIFIIVKSRYRSNNFNYQTWELHMVNIAVDISRKFICNYKAYGKLKCLISPVSPCVLEFVMQTMFWNQMLWK